MRAVAVLLLLAAMAIAAVSAQAPAAAPASDLAIMTKPAANLKKPLIFNPAPVPGAPPSPDEPLIGNTTEVQKLKKAVVVSNIFNGGVEWENATTPNGCPCRRIAAQKHRYDIQYKRAPRVWHGPCGCAHPNATKPVDPLAMLPPVVARLRREVVNTTVWGPCNMTRPQPPVQKIAPHYYPRPHRMHQLVANMGLSPCQQHAAAMAAAAAAAAKKQTIVPQFYGETRADRQRRREQRKEREAARRARRAARRAARKGTPGFP